MKVENHIETHMRPATAEDIALFSNSPDWPTMKAWVGEANGEPLALFGAARFAGGRWLMFCDLKPEARKYKISIVKFGKRAVEELKESGIRFLYAWPDDNEELARKWAKSLGFKPDPRSKAMLRLRIEG